MNQRDDLRGLSVLVLEDEYYVAKALERTLADVRANVFGPFAREEEAIECAERQEPDCGLLDINLGFGPSFRTARLLMSKGTPFIFLTGYDSGVVPEEYFNVPLLQKPVDVSNLVRTILRACPSETGL